MSAITQPLPTQNTQVLGKNPTENTAPKPALKPEKVTSNEELIRQLQKEINDHFPLHLEYKKGCARDACKAKGATTNLGARRRMTVTAEERQCLSITAS